jgi:hypothetical protein
MDKYNMLLSTLRDIKIYALEHGKDMENVILVRENRKYHLASIEDGKSYNYSSSLNAEDMMNYLAGIICGFQIKNKI